MMGDLKIGTVPVECADDDELMRRIADLVNEVYRVAEQGLWVDGADRTDRDEVRELVRHGELVTAERGGLLVGCVMVRQLDHHTDEFGMLAVDSAFRGTGVGRDLVRFVEKRASAAGRRTMQLEILVPTTWSHPSKEFLLEWYGRIGYVHVHKGNLELDYPHLAPKLATPCDYLIHHKVLS